jgi:hypothetical protein
VEVRQFTWLEEDRLDEFAALNSEFGTMAINQQFQILEEYGLPPSNPGGMDKGGVWESGYTKERKVEMKEDSSTKDSFVYPTPRTGGVGAVQRTTRFYLLMIYLRGVLFLVGGYIAFGVGVLLDAIGITARPRWLRKIVGRSMKNTDGNTMNHGSTADYWFATDGERRLLPGNDDRDIVPEVRQRLLTEHTEEKVDEVLDRTIYHWWKSGGWFGTKDESDDYQPSNVDFEDTTSVLSLTTQDEDDWASEPEGQRTPTQSSTRPSWSFSDVQMRDSTPDITDTPLDAATLARLLNPKDKESREEAQILASHFESSISGRIMTRSRYRREVQNERARVLLAGRVMVPSPVQSTDRSHDTFSRTDNHHQLTPNEESEVLESLIIRRRSRKVLNKPITSSTDDDDESAQSGPLCVVCQTSPRTIIAWPCRCLIVCEDCRVSLAMNNFGNCVTCRRTVQGFVRLYVP